MKTPDSLPGQHKYRITSGIPFRRFFAQMLESVQQPEGTNWPMLAAPPARPPPPSGVLQAQRKAQQDRLAGVLSAPQRLLVYTGDLFIGFDGQPTMPAAPGTSPAPPKSLALALAGPRLPVPGEPVSESIIDWSANTTPITGTALQPSTTWRSGVPYGWYGGTMAPPPSSPAPPSAPSAALDTSTIYQDFGSVRPDTMHMTNPAATGTPSPPPPFYRPPAPSTDLDTSTIYQEFGSVRPDTMNMTATGTRGTAPPPPFFRPPAPPPVVPPLYVDPDTKPEARGQWAETSTQQLQESTPVSQYIGPTAGGGYVHSMIMAPSWT